MDSDVVRSSLNGSHDHRGPDDRVRVTSGMTLVEILLVLSLMMALMATVTPNLLNLFQRNAVKRELYSVTSVMGQARTLAVESAQVHLFRCYPGDTVFEILSMRESENGITKQLAEQNSGGYSSAILRGELGPGFEFVEDDSRGRDRGKPIKIFWLPDGTSTSDTIGIIDGEGNRHWIEVDALTGVGKRMTSREVERSRR